MKNSYVLSIDIGTSSCKVVLFNTQAEIVQIATKEYKTYYLENNAVEQNPDEWWESVVYCIKDILQKANVGLADISVIGVDSQSSSMIPISKLGEVLYPAMIWTDKRAVAEKEWVDSHIGQDKISSITGNHNDESNVALKVMWLKNNYPEVYSKTDMVLNAAGYIVYRLTGKFTTNISEGGLTQMFDVRAGEWSDELIDMYGLDKNKLPNIYNCYDVVGGITVEASELLNIAAGTKVVAGAMDAVACGLGCGVVNNGDSFITGGTVTAMGICSYSPNINDAVHVYHHIVPGTWCNVAGVDFGGGSFRWFRDQFMQESLEGTAYDDMNKLAQKVPLGAEKLMYMPTLVGQRCPQWDGNMRGLFFGISPSHTKGHFIRALMEGNAYAVKEICELNKEQGIVSKEITIAGGIAQSELWMNIISDCLGLPLYKAKCEEATALGNMLNAAYGVGIISSFSQVKDIIEKRRVAYSEDNNVLYDKMYKVYKNLYPALKSHFRDLADLNF